MGDCQLWYVCAGITVVSTVAECVLADVLVNASSAVVHCHCLMFELLCLQT